MPLLTLSLASPDRCRSSAAPCSPDTLVCTLFAYLNIASQHTLIQLRLQQYATEYVSPSLSSPHYPALYNPSTLCRSSVFPHNRLLVPWLRITWHAHDVCWRVRSRDFCLCGPTPPPQRPHSISVSLSSPVKHPCAHKKHFFDSIATLSCCSPAPGFWPRPRCHRRRVQGDGQQRQRQAVAP